MYFENKYEPELHHCQRQDSLWGHSSSNDGCRGCFLVAPKHTRALGDDVGGRAKRGSAKSLKTYTQIIIFV
jgi:hypothetical protein